MLDQAKRLKEMGKENGKLKRLKEDVFRRFTPKQAGLGFHMPTVAPKLPVAPIAPQMDQASQAVGA